MGTRARIGLRLSDDSILSVYHHWDGYPSWLGRILESHYNTKEKVEELIDGGDMSVCWTDDRFRNSDGKIEKKAESGYRKKKRVATAMKRLWASLDRRRGSLEKGQRG